MQNMHHSDSGMRLSEAIGLHKDDVMLDAEHPHINVKPNPWHRLKNLNSERAVPSVGPPSVVMPLMKMKLGYNVSRDEIVGGISGC